MSTSDAPFGWRHAIGCAVIIAGTVCALVLMCGKAHAQQFDCTPASPLGITGTSNPGGKWAAWMCGKRVQIVACAADHCTDAVINAAWWVWDRGATLADGNAALTKYKAGSICDPSVRAVWLPDRYKLKSVLGMSDDQVAAICPAR
jgi:hypothetical protein